MTAATNLKRSSVLAITILLIIFQTFIVTPTFLYAKNQDDFTAGLINILSILTIPLALAVICTFILYVKRLFLNNLFVSGALAILACLYMQSFIVVWDYGLLDGQEIAWNSMWLQASTDTVLWLGTISLFLYFRSFIGNHTKHILSLIFALQIFNIANSTLGGPLKYTSTSDNISELAQISKFSPEKNVILIVLDTFESPAFSYTLKRFPEYKDWFRDFIFYEDATASFPTTAASIPAILTGQTYDNSLPLNQFISNVMPNSLPSKFSENGYQTDLVTLDLYCNGAKANNCVSTTKANLADSTKISYRDFLKLFDLALFRQAPHFIKQIIYNDQQWLLQSLNAKRLGPSIHTDSIEFVEQLVQNASNSANKPTFKLFHLMIPHLPLRLDSQCNFTMAFTDITERNFSIQSRCALLLTHKVISKLKELDIYKQSLIIVTADHGFRIPYGTGKRQTDLPFITSAMPLLLVKPPLRDQPFETNSAPAALIDIAKTAADAFGIQNNFPNYSLLQLAPETVRERIFRNYHWHADDWSEKYLPPMEMFAIRGKVADSRSWQRVSTNTK